MVAKAEKGVEGMKMNMDTIQFENRTEIGELIIALEEWQEDHKTDGKNRVVQELIDKLDAMCMSW